MRLQPLVAAVALALTTLGSTPADAVDRYWSITGCGSSAWNLNCWSGTQGGPISGLPPAAGDLAYLSNTGLTNVTVSYASATAPLLGGLIINASGTGFMALSQTGNTLNTSNTTIGNTGSGSFVQSGGTQAVTTALYLGAGAAANGSYTLSGTGAVSSRYTYVGYGGTGTFAQSGGSHNANIFISVGEQTGAQGTYNLSGGTLAASNEYIGYSGTGTFNQTGGTNTIANDLWIGSNAGSVGSYTLSVGTLTASNVKKGTGSSTLNLDGGILSLTGSSIDVDNFVVGSTVSSSNSVTLGSGKSVTAGAITIGKAGKNAFTQNAGSSVTANTLTLGLGIGSSGTYTLAGGTLNVGTVAGGKGISALTVDGGTLNLTGASINVGTFSLGSSGVFTLGSGQTLTAASLTLGANAVGNSSFTLAGGQLNIGAMTGTSSANYGSSFTLDGGTLNLTGASLIVPNFTVAQAVGSSASFTLAGGRSLQADALLTVGGSGNGTFNQAGSVTAGGLVIGDIATGKGTYLQSAGVHNNAGVILVGAAGVGTYTLSGSGTINAASVVLGYQGSGTFNQSGGTHSITSALTIASIAGSSGIYTLSGGTLNVAGINKGSGSSTFNLDGGTLNLTGGNLSVGNFGIGMAAGSNVSLDLRPIYPNSLTVDTLTIGGSGNGALALLSGQNSATSVVLGASAGSSGTLTISGGGLSTASISKGMGDGSLVLNGGGYITLAPGGSIDVDSIGLGMVQSLNIWSSMGVGSGQSVKTGILALGNAGTGRMFQTGGNVTVTDTLLLGAGIDNYFYSFSNSYTLRGGTLTVGTVRKGLGQSLFSIEGGTLNLTGANMDVGLLQVGVGDGSSNFLPGNLTIGAGQTFTAYAARIGMQGAAGTVTQTGGALTLTGELTLGDYSYSYYNYGVGFGHYILSGSGEVTTASTVIGSGNGTGTFDQSGGRHQTGTLYVGRSMGGDYSLSDSGTLVVTDSMILGAYAVGTFGQWGGTATVNKLQMGLYSGSSGLYRLAGGTLNVGNIEKGTGSSTLTIDGGTLNLTGQSITVDNLIIGQWFQQDSSRFSLAAGKTLTTNKVMLGDQWYSDGIFTLDGGTLITGSVSKGYGSSTFNVEGGTIKLTSGGIEVDNFGVGARAGGNAFFTFGSGDVLTATTLTVGIAGNGTFEQSAGSTVTTSALVLGQGASSSGTYTLSGGTLNVTGAVSGGAGASTFNFNGGTLNVAGLFSVGNFNIADTAALTNPTGRQMSIVGAMVNHGAFTNQGMLGIAGTLDNSGVMTLAGGTLNGAGLLVNNGVFNGYGNIAGSGGFVNNGQFTQSGGDLTLANGGANVNYGNWDLVAGHQFNLGGATLSNSGVINLNGAQVAGSGTLANAPGGTITGRGSIASNFINGGVLALTGGALNIARAFANTGVIQLDGVTANLNGAAITNSGTVQGFGTVGNALANSGTIEALGGSLFMGGIVSNSAAGLISSGVGSRVVFTQGLAANAGTINLAGGTFDNNNRALVNNGQISGFGIFRSNLLTNNADTHFTGGNSIVNGNITNSKGGTLEISYNPATFTGNVVNNGTIKTTATTITFTGSFINNGTFRSDPATQIFQDLTLGTQATLQGGVGDVFVINGNLVNNSQASAAFDISAAKLAFTSGAHNLVWSAANLGATLGGYQNNFAVGIFELASGGSLSLTGTTTAAGANALYVHAFLLDGGLAQLGSVQSNGLNIYYDAGDAANAYLSGKTYALAGTGSLMAVAAVPEPHTYAMLLAGLGLMGFAVRRRRAGRAA